MKAYRKKLIGLALAAVFSFSPVSVFASSVNITSGLQIGGDEVECTFDSSRILYGEAKPGTDITFTVSKMDRFGNMVETHRETVTVGSMGLFSETLPLSRGNNYISFADVYKRQPEGFPYSFLRLSAVFAAHATHSPQIPFAYRPAFSAL